MPDNQTIAVYDEQTKAYTDLVKSHSADPVLLNFIEQIEPGGTVLDLGCGPAFDSAVMRDHGLNVDPVDASAQMVRAANERYEINARQARFDEIDAIDKYAGIWANFSLLHATKSELPEILNALQRAMRSGGVFHLGMKSGSGTSRDNLGRLYAYYSQAQLCQHLVAANFHVQDIQTGEGMGLAGIVEAWLMITSVA